MNATPSPFPYGSALTLVIDLFFTVVFFAIMLAYSPRLTLIVAGAIPVFAAIVLSLSPVLRRRVEEKFNPRAEKQAFLVETIAGIETVKSIALEPQIQRRWDNQLAGFTHAIFRAANIANIGSHLIQTVAKLVTAAILFFGAHAVIAGDLTVGQFIAFSMFANHAINPILRLAGMWQEVQQARVSLERLADIPHTPVEPGWKPGRASAGRITGSIEFDNVTHRYRPDTAPRSLSALRSGAEADMPRGISLKIAAGEIVGVVGPSGCGKSTSAKMIDGLYVPESGRVLVDGTDLSLVDKAWLRRQVGVVPQDNILFTGTVRSNIAQADPAAPMDKVIAAAKLAGAHDFILQLPEGYDAQIEERGLNLSRGQRQRIAIARTLLTEPRILFLDEASSALEAEAEEALQRNMLRIAAGRTVIVIAHRLSALRVCGRIVGLEGGVVVEDGTRDELMRGMGPFARFAGKQFH